MEQIFFPDWVYLLAVLGFAPLSSAALFAWLNKLSNMSSTSMPVAFCLGASCSSLLVAGLITALDPSELNALAITAGTTTIFAVCYVGWCLFSYLCETSTLQSSSPRFAPPSRASTAAFVLAVAAFCNIGAICLLAAETPQFGWDTLDWYAPTAIDYISQELSLDTRALPFSFKNGYEYDHPVSTIVLLAYGGWLSIVLAAGKAGALFWLIPWVLNGALILAFLRSNRSGISPILAGLVFVTLPIAENHAVSGGYSEQLLTNAVLASGVSAALGIRHQSTFLIFLGCLFAISCLFLKNIGFIYSLSFMVSLLFYFAYQASYRLLLSIVFMSVTVITILFLYGIDVTFFGTRYRIINYDDCTKNCITLSLGGKIETINWGSPHLIAKNIFYSLIINSSFSILPIAFVIASASLLGRIAIKEGNNCATGENIFLLTFAGIAAASLWSTQFFSPYSFNSSTPWNDTGGSRFFLPVSALWCLASFAFLCNDYKRKTVNKMKEITSVNSHLNRNRN